jgi:hypothetical protein
MNLLDMRKPCWRRCFLLAFSLSLVSMFYIVFKLIFEHKQGNTILPINQRLEDALDSKQHFHMNMSTVPTDYLVVPYREFVLRTSISCRSFKLNNPKKDLSQFHPKYSKYLRGTFPFVVPYANITFEDIEIFFTKILPKKIPNSLFTKTSFAPEIKFEHIPYVYQDGMWTPVGVVSAQRTAILVPLQNREYNAKAFLLNMHAFVRRHQLTYTIILAEQVGYFP